ncbi:rubrerythrin family protein [bacterium]|nr:rubrerythrin family protein [bacterium]
MKNTFADLIDESIQLELNVGEIYRMFQHMFPQDHDFWWTLALEEQNHAALLRSGKEIFAPRDQFPEDLLAKSIRDLKKTNTMLRQMRAEYTTSPPDREMALRTALELEHSAGELHFQHFMDQTDGTPADTIFRKLNKDDKDHAARIQAYMERSGMVKDKG